MDMKLHAGHEGHSHDKAPADANPHDHGHDHAHDGAGHGTMRDYVIGFVLSVILTAIPFWLVMGEVLAAWIDGGPIPVEADLLDAVELHLERAAQRNQQNSTSV